MKRRHFISLAALACPPVAAQPAASAASAASDLPAAPAAPERRDWLDNFGPARQPWMDKLRSLHQGRAEVFRIVQIGDSHTAGDFFTGELRAMLQGQWGNAGAGWVWPAAVAGQRAAVMQYAASGWQTLTARQETGGLPLGGVMARSQAQGSGGYVLLTPAEGYTGPQRVTALVRPARAQGPLRFEDAQGLAHTEAADAAGAAESADAAPGQGWRVIRFRAEPPLRITAQAGDVWELGPVGFETGGAGVTVSALGLNGAQITHAGRWRSGWAQDLLATRADLLIFAFGTNEAFDAHPDPERMEAAWARVLDAARRTLPRAGLLLLGAPDVLRAGAPQGGGDCERPLWLGLVQRMLRRQAQAAQALWWPWQDAMGGPCSSRRWQADGLMAADGVHFTPAGYARAARLLGASLMRWAQTLPEPASEPAPEPPPKA